MFFPPSQLWVYIMQFWGNLLLWGEIKSQLWDKKVAKLFFQWRERGSHIFLINSFKNIYFSWMLSYEVNIIQLLSHAENIQK